MASMLPLKPFSCSHNVICIFLKQKVASPQQGKHNRNRHRQGDLCLFLHLILVITESLSASWRWGCGESMFTTHSFLFFFFLKLINYLFLAVLGLRCCAQAFSSCGKRGPLFIAVRGPLTIAASLAAEHRLQMRRLSNCGSRA